MTRDELRKELAGALDGYVGIDIEDIAADIEAEELAERRAAVEAIDILRGARERGHVAQAEENQARAVLDAWFQGHPNERELFDGDRELRVFFRSGGDRLVYDAANDIKERNPQLYSRLEVLGCLMVDPDAVKEAQRKGHLNPGDIAPYRHTVQRSESLMVEATK